MQGANAALTSDSGALAPATAEFAVNGTAVTCDCAGVLFLPDSGALVVSDLHLEKGAAFARRGMMLPPYDTAATLKRLSAIIMRYNPRMVISLGDSFHDRIGSHFLPDGYRDAPQGDAARARLGLDRRQSRPRLSGGLTAPGCRNCIWKAWCSGTSRNRVRQMEKSPGICIPRRALCGAARRCAGPVLPAMASGC
jgi:hypothetical protein